MRSTIAAVGRILVTLGLLILLFVGYQLWGTGIYQARAQNRLKGEFADLLGSIATTSVPTAAGTTTVPPLGSTTTTAPVGTTTTTAAPTQLPPIHFGDPIAKLQIPRIGIDSIVVQGTARDDLKNGPGHYPATPLPGQYGNAAIAGHRTTYGAPFNRLDELQPGDFILTQSLVGEFVYVVTETLVVAPTEIGVVANTPDEPWLTLTTCNPEFSARERLVVKAKMVEERSDPPESAAQVPADGSQDVGPTADAPYGEAGDALGGDQSLEAGLAGDLDSRGPAVLWGILVGLVGLFWWWSFRRWRLPFTWLAGVVPFLGMLFVFYTFLERTLPAGY